jgi:hypothetical protein
MAEADFFGLSELKGWILQKKYMEVVKTGLKMQVHPGQLNPLGEHAQNHAWLHSLPPPRRGYVDPHEVSETVWKKYAPPLQDPQNEDVELVSCIEVKIPSEGDFKCLMGKKSHISPAHCKFEDEGECVQGFDLSEEQPDWEREQLPTSIVTVVRYVDYRPKKLLRD